MLSAAQLGKTDLPRPRLSCAPPPFVFSDAGLPGPRVLLDPRPKHQDPFLSQFADEENSLHVRLETTNDHSFRAHYPSTFGPSRRLGGQCAPSHAPQSSRPISADLSPAIQTTAHLEVATAPVMPPKSSQPQSSRATLGRNQATELPVATTAEPTFSTRSKPTRLRKVMRGCRLQPRPFPFSDDSSSSSALFPDRAAARSKPEVCAATAASLAAFQTAHLPSIPTLESSPSSMSASFGPNQSIDSEEKQTSASVDTTLKPSSSVFKDDPYHGVSNDRHSYIPLFPVSPQCSSPSSSSSSSSSEDVHELFSDNFAHQELYARSRLLALKRDQEHLARLLNKLPITDAELLLNAHGLLGDDDHDTDGFTSSSCSPSVSNTFSVENEFPYTTSYEPNNMDSLAEAAFTDAPRLKVQLAYQEAIIALWESDRDLCYWLNRFIRITRKNSRCLDFLLGIDDPVLFPTCNVSPDMTATEIKPMAPQAMHSYQQEHGRLLQCHTHNALSPVSLDGHLTMTFASSSSDPENEDSEVLYETSIIQYLDAVKRHTAATPPETIENTTTTSSNHLERQPTSASSSLCSDPYVGPFHPPTSDPCTVTASSSSYFSMPSSAQRQLPPASPSSSFVNTTTCERATPLYHNTSSSTRPYVSQDESLMSSPSSHPLSRHLMLGETGENARPPSPPPSPPLVSTFSHRLALLPSTSREMTMRSSAISAPEPASAMAAPKTPKGKSRSSFSSKEKQCHQQGTLLPCLHTADVTEDVPTRHFREYDEVEKLLLVGHHLQSVAKAQFFIDKFNDEMLHTIHHLKRFRKTQQAYYQVRKACRHIRVDETF